MRFIKRYKSIKNLPDNPVVVFPDKSFASIKDCLLDLKDSSNNNRYYSGYVIFKENDTNGEFCKTDCTPDQAKKNKQKGVYYQAYLFIFADEFEVNYDMMDHDKRKYSSNYDNLSKLSTIYTEASDAMNKLKNFLEFNVRYCIDKSGVGIIVYAREGY